jgi:hypothetical protein
VVLPNMSNISLPNNGTHISLSGEKMGRMMADPYRMDFWDFHP